MLQPLKTLNFLPSIINPTDYETSKNKIEQNSLDWSRIYLQVYTPPAGGSFQIQSVPISAKYIFEIHFGMI